ncbi:MAG: HDIG domain-containing protein [Kiritimatiellae bacterium]|jgi:putative nucleotidyltransferase with HDIG domain|nr:HDIG domain-containing protein [Kiritimatiellia bacterium]
MNDTPKLSRSRHKRTQEKTKQARSREPLLSTQLILCYVFTLIALLFILNSTRGVVLTDLTPGQLAPYTVQAEVDFTSIDLSATQLKRERSAGTVPHVLRVNTREQKDAMRHLDSVFNKAREFQAENLDQNDAEGFAELLQVLGLQESLSSLPLLFDSDLLRELQPELTNLVEARWSEGLISKSDRSSGYQGSIASGKVQIGVSGPVRELETLPTPDETAVRIASRLQSEHDLTGPQSAMIEQLLLDILESNLQIDLMASQNNRELGIASVQPIFAQHRQGDTLMEARIPITRQVVEDLKAHQLKQQNLDDGRYNFARLLGQGLYLAVGLAVSLAFLYLLETPSFSKTNRIFLWVILTVTSLLLGQILIYFSSDLGLFPGHYVRALLPLAVAPMLGTILFGPRLGLAVGFSTSLAHALQHDMDMVIFFCGLCVTVTSAISVRAIHRRSNVFRAGLWIGGIQALILVGSGSLELVPPGIVATHGATAFVSGLIASLVVLLLISPFEYMFNVTTDIRLLELSDMSHPLLSRMALEAPGTYHHSLMVAHLSQAAAREIHANDMLVRVCAYYHDIGKLTKPEFFIENSQGRQNPHDDLSPSMSRLLIISHVKEGVSLAKRYKLPAIIVEGIEQHHGTSVIQYFYHRACQRAEENDKTTIKPEDYRYPGPKPRSTEMGILMLADSLEAASRSIDKNKPGQIDGLVNEIIDEKIRDGQLNHCALTMEQINAIRRSFIFSLNNMLHGRVAYPKKDDGKSEGGEQKDKEKEKGKGKSEEPRKPADEN